MTRRLNQAPTWKELKGWVSDVWDCPGWLPDIRDRQQDFPSGGKMLYNVPG